MFCRTGIKRHILQLRLFVPELYDVERCGTDRHGGIIDVLVEEVPDIFCADGARTVYLYTKGTKGEPPEERMKENHRCGSIFLPFLSPNILFFHFVSTKR